jgi:hypothetical protein
MKLQCTPKIFMLNCVYNSSKQNSLKRKILLLFFIFFCIVSQAQVNLDSGLVAYYPFNGNANDESGNKNNGIVHGPTLAVDRLGIPNCAYFFAKSTDLISTSTQLQCATTFSISVWFKTVSNVGKIFGFENTQTGLGVDFDRILYLNGSGKLYFGIWNDGVKSVNTNFSVNDNQWYHAVAVMSKEAAATKKHSGLTRRAKTKPTATKPAMNAKASLGFIKPLGMGL